MSPRLNENTLDHAGDMRSWGAERMDAELAIEIIEEERRRLARDIHDGPAQLLTNLTMRLEVVKEMIRRNPQSALPEIQRVQDLMRASVGEIRRMIYDLRPVEMVEGGLNEALRTYAERCQYLLRVPICVTLCSELPSLPDALSIGVFRVVQECVTNSLKHARAERIDVELCAREGELTVIVRDDGVGFDPGAGTRRGGSFGLLGMRERARVIGAQIDVNSKPGQGTAVTLRIAVGAAATGGKTGS